MSATEDAMKTVRLEADLKATRLQISMLNNIIEQARIALDEDDIEKARAALSET